MYFIPDSKDGDYSVHKYLKSQIQDVGGLNFTLKFNYIIIIIIIYASVA